MIKFCIGIDIKRFHTDNPKVFFDRTLQSFFYQEEILHELFYIYTLEQKEVANTRIFTF